MKIEIEAGAIRLPRGHSLKVRDGAGTTLCAREGSLWITEEGNQRDIVLEPGHCFQLRRSGLAIVHAFADASVAINAGG